MRDNVKGGALTETTFFILLSVYTPNHGYGIMQFIESQTNGRLSLGAGTLYGAINTLLKKGWIEPCPSGDHSRKKEYLITEMGKRITKEELRRLAQVYSTAEKIMGESGHD